jgi:hypothetical protein
MIEHLLVATFTIIIFLAGFYLGLGCKRDKDQSKVAKSLSSYIPKWGSSKPIIEYDPYDDALQNPRIKGVNTVE